MPVDPSQDLAIMLQARGGQRLILQKGEIVFATDDPARGLFFVEMGQVRLVRHAIGPWTLGSLAPGETWRCSNRAAWRALRAYEERLSR